MNAASEPNAELMLEAWHDVVDALADLSALIAGDEYENVGSATIMTDDTDDPVVTIAVGRDAMFVQSTVGKSRMVVTMSSFVV